MLHLKSAREVNVSLTGEVKSQKKVTGIRKLFKIEENSSFNFKKDLFIKKKIIKL